MNKLAAFGQSLPKKPKNLIKSSTQQLKLNSQTPTLKLINHPVNIQLGFNLRETQSYASSPHNRLEGPKSFRPSPSPKEKAELEKILKKSLNKFKLQKQELEKIKENATLWKEKRKKKLDEYNLQTRTENKIKFKSEVFRPRSAWGSPEIKEHLSEHKHICQRNSAVTSIERRANIGLEFYNLKSPRNGTPRTLKDNIKFEGKRKPYEDKKKIEDFIKKKRKERKKLVKVQKEKEEELEFKRVSQLIHVEQVAKKLLKKRKKPKKDLKKVKTLKRSNSKYNLNESFTQNNISKKKSLCFSEDEEVLNIMQVRKLAQPDQNSREGRECAIFGNFSNQFSREAANATEIANKILGNRLKAEDYSIIGSSSMPVIELKSVSHDSSSDISDQHQDLKKRLEDLKFRVEKAKEIADNSYIEIGVEKDIAIHKIVKWVNKKYISQYFALIKHFDKKNLCIENSDLSEVKSEAHDNNKDSPKEELEEVLSSLVHKKLQSKEGSVDMETLWDKIEFNYKNTEFLQDPEPLPPLAPISDEPPKNIKQGSEISSSLMEQLKKIQYQSGDYLSFGNIEEQTNLELIDSPSLMSINSRKSSEVYYNSIIFPFPNPPSKEIFLDPEPKKPLVIPMKSPNAILIDENPSSSDYSIAIKDNSSIATPEAEEIEEFSSINFDLNIKKTSCPETSINPFSISEETLVLDEDEISKKVIYTMIQFIFQDLIYECISNSYKKHYLQLVGNAVLVMDDVYVKTGVSSVMNFLNKIWSIVNNDLGKFMGNIMSNEIHVITLEIIQSNQQVNNFFIIPLEVLNEAETSSDFSISFSLTEPLSEYVKHHNRMIFDCINHVLFDISQDLNPPSWKSGSNPDMFFKPELILQKVNQKIRSNCLVNAGRIPSISMIGEDGKIDETLLQKVRENGLALLLSLDIQQDEKDWCDYGFEETQIKIELSNVIFELLLLETAEIFTEDIY